MSSNTNIPTWVMPSWMEKYADKYVPDKNTCEWHMNDHKSNVLVNAPLAMSIVATKCQVEVLVKLYNDGILQ